GDVEGALVGLAVVADDAGAVEGEGDRQVLDADIVHDLVIAALEEGGVDGDDRPESLGGETAGEGYGVLLRDADVEDAIRVGLLGGDQAGALEHRGGDRDHAPVEPHELGGGIGEDFRVGRGGRL